MNSTKQNNKPSTQKIDQFTSLAEDIADLLFDLENKKIINRTQSNYISFKLDIIFTKHIKS